MANARDVNVVLWTIGHSNRSLESFLKLLASFEIRALADVRRFPGSRRWPHFASEALRDALSARGIAYEWLPSLGGRRAARPDSSNTGWRNASFRGYADYMETEEFAAGLTALMSMTCAMPTAMMCAEALWWQCHRSLIADAVEVSGIPVMHILGSENAVRHPMTSPARVDDGVLSYPAQPPDIPQEDLFS